MKKPIQVKKINIFHDPSQKITLSEFSSLGKNELFSIKKILIIKWGGMGDIILSSAVIDDILNCFHYANVQINTLPQWLPLLKQDKRIKKLWGFNFGSGIQKISNIFKWIKIVEKENYDLIIDLQTNDRSRVLLSILKIFFKAPKYIIGNHAIYPYFPRPASKRKIDQPLLLQKRTIATIGIQPKRNSPFLVHKKINKKLKNLFTKYGLINNNFIVFIPGGSKNNKLKRWGVKNFIELSEFLSKKNYKIVLVGGPDDLVENDSIYEGNKEIINLTNKFPLLDLIHIFKAARYIIANDTGPTHLAACTSTPIIQITGPTNPYKVKPFGTQIKSVQSDIPCKSCYKKKCNHHSCMSGIKPQFIFDLIKNNL